MKKRIDILSITYIILIVSVISFKGYIFDYVYKLVLILFASLFILKVIFSNKKSIKLNKKYCIYLYLFIFMLIISLIYTVDFNLSSIHIYMIIQEILVATLILIYAIEIGNLKFSKFISIAGAVSIILIMLVYPIDKSLRLGLNNIGTNGLGINLSICLLFSIYLLIKNNKKRNLFISIFIASGIIMTGSRQALILGIGISIIYLINTKRSVLKYIKYIFFIIVITSIFYNVSIKNKFLYDVIGSRIQPIVEGLFTNEEVEAYAFSSRDKLLDIGIENIKKKPLLGHGIGTFKYFNNYNSASNSHNNFIEVMVGTGYLGLIVFYYYQFYVLIILLKKKKYSDNAMLYFYSLLMMIFMGLTSITYKYIINYIIIGLSINCISGGE